MAVTKFLEEKWRRAFWFFDVDRDGVLSKEDFQQLADYISERGGETLEERVKLTKAILKWDGLLKPTGPDQRLSEDLFVQNLAEIHRYPENHARLAGDSFSTLFDIIDLNKDGLISHDELKIYYEGHGFKDEGFISKVFDKLDVYKDGYISREEYVTALVSYWVSEDENDKYSFVYDPAAL